MRAIATNQRAITKDKKKGKGSEPKAKEHHAQRKKLRERSLAKRLQEEHDKKGTTLKARKL